MNVNKVFFFKEGVLVMLIRNFFDILVNGLFGIVFKLEDDGFIVKFEDKIIKLSKVIFSVYDFF